jgi:hypothetical protein
MDRSGLAKYVERGGEIVYSPPGVATGVRMYAFVLLADANHLQRMFDRYLNDPSGGAVDFEPAGSLIVLNFTTLEHVGALTPPDDRRGFFLENEMAIWTLGYDRQRSTYETFVPYMVVDHGAALAMGREVYGFPKQLGVVKMPDPGGRPDEFVLSVDGVPAWGPRQQFELHPLIRIHQTDTDAPLPTHGFSSQGHLVSEMARLLAEHPDVMRVARDDHAGDDLDHAARAAELLATETLPMVFLKQIRDGRLPLHACYQAIQTADFVVTGFRGAGQLPGEYHIEIDDLANEPIRRDLGLPDGTIVPVGAYWVDFDFTLSIAQEIWRAPTPPRIHITTRDSR